MFKFLLPLAIIGMSAPAEARDYRDNRYHHNDRYDRHRDRNDAGLLIGGLVLGTIIGSAIDNDRRSDYNYRRYNDRYYNRYNREHCYVERFRDRRGNIVTQRTCYR